MLFRERAPESVVWQRFRSGRERFYFEERPDGIYAAQVVVNSERAVDLLYTLTEHFPPAVDLRIDNHRQHTRWSGTDVALPDVREAIARLKVPLATYGGVEITVFTADDQITLTDALGLYLFARNDRWLYLLQGMDLEASLSREPSLRDLTQPWSREDVPAFREAIDAVVDWLSLEPAE